MKQNSLEKILITHCAPTLAGIKSAGLFSFRTNSIELLEKEIDCLNACLNVKGVYVKEMKTTNDYALIYTYRKSHLEKDIFKEEAKCLLSSYGYPEGNTEELLEYLKERLVSSDGFPHEIGVFLGYPIEDVKGFIVNHGKKYIFSGLWKVYDNESEAQRLFKKISKCTRIYSKVFAEGRAITQMTVCAENSLYL